MPAAKKRKKTTTQTNPKPAPIGRKIKARAFRLRRTKRNGLVVDIFR